MPLSPTKQSNRYQAGHRSSNRATSRRPTSLIAITLLAALFLTPALTGCQAPADRAAQEVILATTTSTRDSGLLDVLVPMFEAEHPYTVKPIAVGTGQALQLGQRGEADVLLTHAPAAEKPLVDEGYVSSRRLIMHNDFVLVGPPADPAKLKESQTATAALTAIADAQAMFMSRGDDSGTHKMEKALWEAAAVSPEGAWYQEAGAGMGDTLRVASEKDGYTLTDRATYLALKDTLSLEVVFAGDPVLLNIYHVMEVSSAKFETVNAAGAKAFADFLLSTEAQETIAEFGVDRFDEPLFVPAGGKTEQELTGKTP